MGYTGKAKREYQRRWVAARRAAYFADKTCVDCDGIDRLELDHVDAKTKLYNPASLWSMSDKNPKKQAELNKCVVRCYSCHRAKTTEKRENPNSISHAHAVLSVDDVAKIRSMYATGLYKQSELGIMFGVDRRHIWDLVHRKSRKFE